MEPQSVAHTSQPSLFSVSLFFLSHLFHFSYISSFHCWAGLGLSASFLWILGHSDFPCIPYLSILPAGVLVKNVGTLLLNWFPRIQTYLTHSAASSPWPKHLHSPSSALSSLMSVPINFFCIATILFLSPRFRLFLEANGWQKGGALILPYVFLSKVSRCLCLNVHSHSRMSHCALCLTRTSDQTHPWDTLDVRELNRDNGRFAYRIQGSRCGFGSCCNLLAVRKLFLLGTRS